jgi:hypothetical protein
LAGKWRGGRKFHNRNDFEFRAVYGAADQLAAKCDGSRTQQLRRNDVREFCGDRHSSATANRGHDLADIRDGSLGSYTAIFRYSDRTDESECDLAGERSGWRNCIEWNDLVLRALYSTYNQLPARCHSGRT